MKDIKADVKCMPSTVKLVRGERLDDSKNAKEVQKGQNNLKSYESRKI